MKQQRKRLNEKDAAKISEIRTLQNTQIRQIVDSSRHMASAKLDHDKALASLEALYVESNKFQERLGRKYGIVGVCFVTPDLLIISV